MGVLEFGEGGDRAVEEPGGGVGAEPGGFAETSQLHAQASLTPGRRVAVREEERFGHAHIVLDSLPEWGSFRVRSEID
ncbi:hypothetical protein GCM10027589_41510 [Actinocorallia lasiicapitis]